MITVKIIHFFKGCKAVYIYQNITVKLSDRTVSKLFKRRCPVCHSVEQYKNDKWKHIGYDISMYDNNYNRRF